MRVQLLSPRISAFSPWIASVVSDRHSREKGNFDHSSAKLTRSWRPSDGCDHQHKLKHLTQRIRLTGRDLFSRKNQPGTRCLPKASLSARQRSGRSWSRSRHYLTVANWSFMTHFDRRAHLIAAAQNERVASFRYAQRLKTARRRVAAYCGAGFPRS